ncbi:MAG: pyocin knob domain-containing protein [Pseudomonadota bacterium]
MADLKKISELPPSIAASEQDIYPVVQNGNTLNQTLEKLRQAIIGGWQTHVSSFLSSADALAARTSIGLGAVNNTADASKPVSTAQQAAIISSLASFGLGATSAPVITDYNAVSTGGFYRDQGNSANSPLAAGSVGVLLNIQYSTAGQLQLVARLTSITAANQLFWRSRAGGIWAGWRELAPLDSPVFTSPIRLSQYTMATLPSASAYPGSIIDVTNATGGPKACRSDSSAWKILNTTTTVS